jgi:hypothetical protein
MMLDSVVSEQHPAADVMGAFSTMPWSRRRGTMAVWPGHKREPPARLRVPVEGDDAADVEESDLEAADEDGGGLLRAGGGGGRRGAVAVVGVAPGHGVCAARACRVCGARVPEEERICLATGAGRNGCPPPHRFRAARHPPHPVTAPLPIFSLSPPSPSLARAVAQEI